MRYNDLPLREPVHSPSLLPVPGTRVHIGNNRGILPFWYIQSKFFLSGVDNFASGFEINFLKLIFSSLTNSSGIISYCAVMMIRRFRPINLAVLL
jgi:hypothetical protein